MATEYWPRQRFAWNVLILFDLCDLNIEIFKLYILLHIPFCTAVILHMPTIERAFAHATCHVWP